MSNVSMAVGERMETDDLNFYVPAETYGAAETCHAAILHYWMDQML